jgi:hypothetical protein
VEYTANKLKKKKLNLRYMVWVLLSHTPKKAFSHNIILMTIDQFLPKQYQLSLSNQLLEETPSHAPLAPPPPGPQSKPANQIRPPSDSTPLIFKSYSLRLETILQKGIWSVSIGLVWCSRPFPYFSLLILPIPLTTEAFFPSCEALTKLYCI